MTQADTLKLLKKKRKFLSTKEIAKELKIGRGSTSVNLNKLYNQGLVMRKEVQNIYFSYLWKAK